MTKKPPPPVLGPPRVSDPSMWSSTAHIITTLAYGLGRIGVDPERDLTGAHAETYRGLVDGRSDRAFATLFDWRPLDIPKLLDENHRARKPKVDLIVRFTKPGNLVIEWEPTGQEYHYGTGEERDTSDTDWRRFRRIAPIAERPSNELYFIRSVRMTVSIFERGTSDANASYDRKNVSEVLLIAISRLVEETAKALAPLFEVQIPNVIIMLDGDGKEMSYSSQRLAKWFIEDAETREFKEEAEELEKLFETVGFCAEEFVWAWQEADKTKPKAPAPLQASKNDRVLKFLVERWPATTIDAVTKLVELLPVHRPDIFPPPRIK